MQIDSVFMYSPAILQNLAAVSVGAGIVMTYGIRDVLREIKTVIGVFVCVAVHQNCTPKNRMTLRKTKAITNCIIDSKTKTKARYIVRCTMSLNEYSSKKGIVNHLNPTRTTGNNARNMATINHQYCLKKEISSLIMLTLPGSSVYCTSVRTGISSCCMSSQ